MEILINLFEWDSCCNTILCLLEYINQEAFIAQQLYMQFYFRASLFKEVESKILLLEVILVWL